MWKLSENASIANDANNHSESKTKRLPMKIKMASCMCTVAMLFPLSFAPAGYAQSSSEQAPVAAPTTISDPAAVYLTNGSVLQGVEILKIEDQQVILWGVPGMDKAKAYPVAEIDKILFAQGEEHKTGIVRKNGDQLYGKVKSYKNGAWKIALEGSGELTFDGKGSELFRSINFKDCCRAAEPQPQTGPKKRGASVQFIFDGTPLTIREPDTSASWNPLKVPEKYGVKKNKLAQGMWSGYWYAPKTGQYVFTLRSQCAHGYGCFGSSVSLNGETIFQGNAPRPNGHQKILNLSEGYYPIEVHISMNGRYAEKTIDTFTITAQIISDKAGGAQSITPASLYHD